MIENKKCHILIVLLFLAVVAKSQVIIDWDSQWSYFKGLSEPSQPNTLWTGTSFNATAWAVGNAPFRYGTGSGGTELTDMFGKYSTLYLRRDFQIDNIAEIDELYIYVDFDDGFIVWLNGKQVAQFNAPRNNVYNQLATANHDAGEWMKFTLLRKDIELLNGKNIIAVQGFNASRSSTDFLLNLKLEGKKKLPETDPVTIDINSGFFNNPFNIKISSAKTGETVKYTLDGSDPRISATAITAVSPVTVSINPNSTAGGRGTTGGVVVRASKFANGFDPSRPITRTYLFLSAVKTQAHPGGKWPTTNINGQIIDLPMDSKIFNDARYKNLMEQSLLDIPTIAVSTDLDNLFNSKTGIYVNAEFHGSSWERPANVELINPDGSPGFNIDAGLRIRGGWSRHDDYPKHAFRLFFRSDYGAAKLNFPLFGDEGVDEFDKVDLRTSQNYSWANAGNEANHHTLNRDVFSRDCQRDMHQPYTRSRYYHLYLNGLYWGIFQTQERSESNFAESYFGGKTEDYDVIKVDIGQNFNVYEIEATDGTTDAWQAVWNMCQQGFAPNANYFKLIGLNEAGKPDTSLNVWVDIDNLIDYMLIIFYAGNFDAPVSKFSQNYNPNNFYAIYNKTKKREGFKFFIHDAEHTLLTDAVGPGIGLFENRVNIGTISSQRMYVSYFGKFHPQWLHFKLSENPEYRIRFADRVYRHFFNNGALTPDSCISRFKKTAQMLDLAIIAESARWGDSKNSPARNKYDHWLPAVNRVINDYMPYRTQIVIDQLLAENLYLSLLPPVFKNNGVIIKSDKITISEGYQLTMENQNTSGSIIYTTDGTDPRAVGGAISASAKNAGNSGNVVALPGSRVKARIKYMNDWSALHEIVFEDAGLFTTLKITELHYHPQDVGQVNGKELEFIELKNIGTKTLDLSGMTFTAGIRFTFPEGTLLQPGVFVVIASNSVEFQKLYGFYPDFAYNGNLSNAGERIVLQSATYQNVLCLTYDDNSPWPAKADGKGYSMVAKNTNPWGDPNLPEYWTISKNINGSPGADDPGSVTEVEDNNINEQVEFLIWPNPALSSFHIGFEMPVEDKVEITLFDLNGRVMEMLMNDNLPAGYHEKLFHPQKLTASGVYLIKLKTGSFSITKKLMYRK